jgi:hypothetical protein
MILDKLILHGKARVIIPLALFSDVLKVETMERC